MTKQIIDLFWDFLQSRDMKEQFINDFKIIANGRDLDIDSYLASVDFGRVFSDLPPDFRSEAWSLTMTDFWLDWLYEKTGISLQSDGNASKEDLSLTEGYKFCIRCCRPKPVSEFNKNSLSSDFLNPYCKSCAVHDKSKVQVIDENEAILFGDFLFFSPAVSNSIHTANFRKCKIVPDGDILNLRFFGSGSQSSMFTYSAFSNCAALKNTREILDRIRAFFHISAQAADPHAYKLKIRSVLRDENNLISGICVVRCIPWDFRQPATDSPEPAVEMPEHDEAASQGEILPSRLNEEQKVEEPAPDPSAPEDSALVPEELPETCSKEYTRKHSEETLRVCGYDFYLYDLPLEVKTYLENNGFDKIFDILERVVGRELSNMFDGKDLRYKSVSYSLARILKNHGWKLRRPVVGYKDFE